MKSVFESYNSFFTDGCLENLSHDLEQAGFEIGFALSAKRMSNAYRNTIRVFAAYLMSHPVNVAVKNPCIKDGDLFNTLKQSPSFVRLAFVESDVDAIVNHLLKPNVFPRINKYEVTDDCDVKATFNGEFNVPYFDHTELPQMLKDAVCIYLFGMPISDLAILPELKRLYILSGQVMESVMYISIGTFFCNDLCADAYRYGISISYWCSIFDDTWYNVDRQLEDGFVTILNPRNPAKVTCVSTLYLGKYFTTNMAVFKMMYENNTFHTIRFTNREVPVQSMVNGKPAGVSNRIVNVPVYYDDGDEYLVSDLVDDKYVYNEYFLHDVGRL